MPSPDPDDQIGNSVSEDITEKCSDIAGKKYNEMENTSRESLPKSR